jgi:hypothetical protein
MQLAIHKPVVGHVVDGATLPIELDLAAVLFPVNEVAGYLLGVVNYVSPSTLQTFRR